MTPLFLKGRKKPIRLGDLYKVLAENRSQSLGFELEKAWDSEVVSYSRKNAINKTQPSLLKVLLRVYGMRYLLLGIFVGVEELLVQ